MGKATRWLKGLLSKIRSDSPPSDPPKEKRRWSLLKSSSPNAALHRRGGGNPTPSTSSLRSHSPHPAPAKNAASNDARHHAIAVAAASAVAAEAAVAAAQAAADVVRLAASGRVYAAAPPPAHVSLCDALDSWAAVVIQSHFRGYLARRALRALKGLVKLQALVRGHIMRRKAAETMRSIQAMLRAQERARSMRAYESPNSSEKSSQTYHRGPPTPEKFEQISYSKNTKNTQSAMPKGSRPRSINKVIIHPDQRYLNPSWSESQFDESTWAARWRHPQHRTTASSSGEEEYHIKPDKVLEVDAGKPPKQGPKRRKNLFESIGLVSSNPKEDLSAYQTTFKRSTQDEDEEVAFCTAENSPQCYSASSRGGLSSRRQSPRTPTKSDASATSCVSIYSDCPSYMAYTESSRAKMRSLSAPRQRQQQCQERVCPTKRWSVHQQRGVPSSGAMEACFASKAYAGSGHLERLGVPVRNNAPAYYSGCLD